MELLISLSSDKETRYLKTRFAAATAGQTQRSFLVEFWLWANTEFFAGKMRLPKFVLHLPSEIAADPLNPQGMWFPEVRTMFVAAEHFNKGWGAVYSVALHEMCHQAVSEIDGTEEPDAHGKRWAKWMRHCKLPVNNMMWLRDPNAKLTKTQMKNWDASNARLNATQSNDLAAKRIPKFGTPVRYMDQVQYKLHNEVLVGITEHEGERCWVLVGEADIGTNLVTYHETQFALFETDFKPSPALLRYATKIHKFMGLK